jgi:hypothetical protein
VDDDIDDKCSHNKKARTANKNHELGNILSTNKGDNLSNNLSENICHSLDDNTGKPGPAIHSVIGLM